MCSAFIDNGHQVDLIGYKGDKTVDIADYYGEKKEIPTTLFRIAPKAGETVKLALQCYFWLMKNGKKKQYNIIYSRNILASVFTLPIKTPLIHEIHSPARTRIHSLLEKVLLNSKKLKRIVFITDSLKQHYLKTYPDLNRKKDLIVLADASDKFPSGVEPADLNKNGRYKVGYIGHLYPGKGGELITTVASLCPNIDFHIVGGKRSDVERLQKLTTGDNVKFTGHISHKATKTYLAAFDLVLAPYSEKVSLAKTKQDIGKWMSPLKLFEYMSAQKPIVCSDLPPLREVMRDNDNCLLVPHNSPEAWRDAINTLKDDQNRSKRIALKGHHDFMAHHTWEKRTEKSLDGLNI